MSQEVRWQTYTTMPSYTQVKFWLSPCALEIHNEMFIDEVIIIAE